MSPQTTSGPITKHGRYVLTTSRLHTWAAFDANDIDAIEREAQALVLDALEAAVRGLVGPSPRAGTGETPPRLYVDAAAILEAIQQQRSKP